MLRWQGNFFKCFGLISAGMMLFRMMPVFSQSPPTLNTPETLDLDPEIIENSPVLQRWHRQIPNVLEQIKQEPSFRTRVRLGYSQYPANDNVSGWNIGVEDVFLGKTVTLSADYQGSFNGNQTASGATLQYYVRPLGSYVNFAPVVGYRHLNSEDYTAGGLNVGGKMMVALSRGGAADLSVTQTWVMPTTENEVGITTLSVGYAISNRFRISTDIQKQNAPESKESRVGIVLEWMP